MTNKNDILLIEPFEQGKTNLAEEKPKNKMPTRRSKRRRRSTSGSGSKSGTMPNRKSKVTVPKKKDKGSKVGNLLRRKTRKSKKELDQAVKKARKIKDSFEVKDRNKVIELDETGRQAKKILDGDFYIVAVTSVWHANHEPELRKDSIGLLVDRLRQNYEQFQITYMENDEPDLASFRNKLIDYEKIFEVGIDAPVGIMNGDVETLIAILDDPNIEYSLEIYNIIEKILKERDAEVEKVDLGDVAYASKDLIVQSLYDSGQFWLKMLTPWAENAGAIDQAQACFESNPYAAAFGLLNGTAYGGFINRPLWSRIALTTIGAPYGAIKVGDRAVKRTIDALGPLEKYASGGLSSGAISRTAGKVYNYKLGRLALLAVAAASAAGLYYAGEAVVPDDGEDVNAIRNTLQDGGEVISGPLGELVEDFAPNIIAQVLEFIMPGSETTVKYKKQIKDFKPGSGPAAEIKYQTNLHIDKVLGNIPTEKEIKDKTYVNAVSKLQKMTAKIKANEGKANSLDCYLYTLAGSFLISNLARRGITKASFTLGTGLSEKCNAFAARLGDWSNRNLYTGRTKQILELKEGNDLALWLTLKKALPESLGDDLGNIRIIDNGLGRVEMDITDLLRAPIENVNPIPFNTLDAQTQKALKNFVDKNGQIVINMDNARAQLKTQAAEALNGGLNDLLTSTNQIYKTADIPTRLRRLASNLDLHRQLRGNPNRILISHYQGTARLISEMINEVSDAAGNVFQKDLKDLRKYSEFVRQTITNTNIDHKSILKAIDGWKTSLKGTDAAKRVPSFDAISSKLPIDMRIDRKIFKNQDPDIFINNLYQLQELEEKLVTKFALIDEMFALEKKVLKNFQGKIPSGTPKTFDEFIGSSTDPMFANLISTFRRQFNDFIEYLPTSPIGVGTRMTFDNIKTAVKAEFELAKYIVVNTSRQAYNSLRQVNLATVKEFFKDNMPEIILTAVVGTAFYKLLEGLELRLSRNSEPEPETVKENKAILDEANRKAFLSFLGQFKKDILNMENQYQGTKGESPIDEIEEELGNISDPQGKLDYLFKIFNSIQKKNKQKNENRIITMKKTDLQKLVSEMLNENTGMGYAKYPYASNEYSEEEPDEDYMTEWNSLVDEVCSQKKRNIDGDPNTGEDSAIELAKLLIKDLDLFREVLELAGSNKSVGTEIMSQLKAAKEKYSQTPKV